MIILETPRLLLGTWTKDKLQDLYALYQHPQTLEFYSNKHFTYQQAQKLLSEFIEHQENYGFSLWYCQLKATKQLIGFTGFMTLENHLGVDIGYHFTRSVWQQGFATEAAQHCLNYGFNTLLFKRVFGITHPNNQASKQVLTKIGMSLQGQIIYRDRMFDLYSIDKQVAPSSAYC